MRTTYDIGQEENTLCLLHAQALREAAQCEALCAGRSPKDHEINRRYTEADKESLQAFVMKAAGGLHEDNNNEFYFNPEESIAAVQQFTRAHIEIATASIKTTMHHAPAFANNHDDTSLLVDTEITPQPGMADKKRNLFRHYATDIGLNDHQIEKTFDFMQGRQLIA